MAGHWPPKKKFLELISQSPDYPQRLKDLRKSDKASQKHLTAPTKRLERNGYHQWRGPKYIHLHGGRGVYDQPPWTKLPADAVQKAKRSPPSKAAIFRIIGDRDSAGWDEIARFPEAGGGFPGPKHFFDIEPSKPAAFKPKGLKTPRLKFFETFKRPDGGPPPYGWTAHHLLAVENVQSGNSDRPFSDETLEFIVMSFWEVDNGHNLMLLPTRAQATSAYHCLLAHVDNHPQYRIWCRSKLRDLDTRLEKEVQKIKDQRSKKDKQKAHDDFLDLLVDEIYAAENKFWDKLKKLGEDDVASVLEKGSGLRGDLAAPRGKQRWGALA